MKLLSIILSSLSLIVVVATIVFEGKFKIEKKEKFNFKNFKKELKKLSPYGWFLLILLISLSFGNGIVSYKNIVDYDKKYTQDTIKFNSLLKLSYQDTLRLTGIVNELKDKRKNDSITISYLLDLTKVNGLKSDSIKIQIVDNAIKALDEQRKIIERNNNNAFINLSHELLLNLIVLNETYTEKKAMQYKDSTIFLANDLKNQAIKKYIQVSKSKDIIDILNEISISIDKVDRDINQIMLNKEKEKRVLLIKQFIKNVMIAKILTADLLGKTYDKTKYQEFEKMHLFKERTNEIDIKIIDSLILSHKQKRQYQIIYSN